ncbi:hybrid sensor histidine kinase/response regulator transcription factor [Spirosoma sp. KUDC1026]|uniref:hybrid sensor histidine kinase/response regulator transcription factor n=1 Tax=Spirosoma sp. KUDC1026 TaxID=2745947 RepID=UPI00159BC21B|nr:hybrid sensor histidine kinase/response regulator transcription factor [Spirosoma sp. KUDC1026]QKZ13502.1 helix-turn-helix domain-containing protein [Spirosoma sp. KUDC1026]
MDLSGFGRPRFWHAQHPVYHLKWVSGLRKRFIKQYSHLPVCRSIIFLLFLSISAAVAQLSPKRSPQLTTANGLPSNEIAGVVQDRAGFLWIATSDGLARYDGRATKVFRNRPGDTLSLADNKIRDLVVAPDGSFVINTESGTIQRFDPASERFTTLIHRQVLDRNKALVNQIQLSADGKHLWGLLSGVRLVDYDLHRKTLRIYDLPTLVGSVNEVHDFILAPTGHIYGETMAGLLQFDTRTGRKRIIPFPFPTIDRVRGMNFHSADRHQVTLGPAGQIAVFGYDVVAFYDPVHDRFRTIPIPNVVKVSSSGVRKLATPIPYGLKTLSADRLYLGYLNRLYQLDKTGQFSLLRQAETATDRLAPWLIDRSGVLWITDGSTGLTQLDLRALPLDYVSRKKSFCDDLLEEDLGITLPDSFEVWATENWPRYTRDSRGNYYLCDPSRVYRHVVNNQTINELPTFGELNGHVCCNLCLKTSRRGEIWVYNNRLGLLAVSPDGTKGHSYPNSQLPLTHLYPNYDAGDIQPLGQSIWVGSQFGLGLYRYDIRRQRYDAPLRNKPQSTNSLPVNSINCLSADPNDSTVLWIGTLGGGLCRLNTRTMRFQRLGEAEGFPNGAIQSIETDDQGMLWCATKQGLVRVNPKTLKWRHFTSDDGLTETAFMRTSSAHLPDGRLVFGTPNGRIIFNPGAIQDDTYEPPIVLTALLINNKPTDANLTAETNLLPAPINTLSELVLDHTQNFLTIGFAGLHYGKTEKLQYRYRLTGVDNDWVEVGTQNTANYTQLAPGRYIFSVNSTRSDGQWSRQARRLLIRIKPPFWATWWAYLLYGLAFGGLVLGFIRFRIQQGQQHQEITLKRREADQLRAVDEVKSRFFANITHEFRTPLTLILSPAEKLLKTPDQDTYTRHLMASIHRNAVHLLRLVNQLLDLAKLEDNSMRVTFVRGDGVEFIQRLVDSFYPMAATQQISLTVDIINSGQEHPHGPWLFDADKWETIITNLLSNALKFTPAGGQILLTIDPSSVEQLVLHLADTGIGIPPDKLPHIFDRFYQVDTSQTRAYEGTGIGLALVRELIELLHGTIAVESRTESPSGTTFILTLPLLPATAQPDAPAVTFPGTSLLVADSDPAPSTTSVRQPSAVIADDAPLVLVVEDNDELRAFMAGELADHYRVLTAADGEEGWLLCQRDLPDVVLTDVMMPRLDGFQLTHCIKSTLATNHIAVVLLTARAAHTSRLAGLEQGADDYLSKPFHVDELFLRLNNMLTRQANLRAFLYRQLSSPAGQTNEPIPDPFIGQLHQAIETRLDDTTFGVDDLALAVGMSRRTLYRKMTAVSNMSANDFIRHYRLQRATQLLRAGRSIADIAYTVGFESPAYFATVFKHTYQQTPSEFLNRQLD